MDNTFERLTEILRNGILAAMDDDNRYLYTDVVDYMMAHGVTIATDNNVGDKLTPTNADRIRAMSDDELAKSLSKTVVDVMCYSHNVKESVDKFPKEMWEELVKEYLEWLQQPAEKG